MEPKDIVELVKAVALLAWPLIAAVVLAALFPTIVAIARSRSFSVKVAGMEISVQDATEKLQSQIDDLQHQVIALRGEGGPSVARTAEAVAAPVAPSPARGPRVLWVDDNMSNNAFQIGQLHDQGVTVVQSASTEDAMAILAGSPPFDAVISDMGRREGGMYQVQAGLNLIRRMRQADILTPFIVYSSQRYADSNRAAVKAAGGDGATSSPVELLEWVRGKLAAPKA